MAVDRADVIKTKLLEQRARNDKPFDMLLRAAREFPD